MTDKVEDVTGRCEICSTHVHRDLDGEYPELCYGCKLDNDNSVDHAEYMLDDKYTLDDMNNEYSDEQR